MNTQILSLDKSFFRNIDNLAKMNLEEEKVNVYRNTNIYPAFRYNNNDKNLDLINKVSPISIYKNKSIFSVEKPMQTEHDEETINTAFFNNYNDYTDYGYFKYQNNKFPEYLKHRPTPKNNLFDLF